MICDRDNSQDQIQKNIGLIYTIIDNNSCCSLPSKLSISNPEFKETSYHSLYDELCSENGVLREQLQRLIQVENRNQELETQLIQEQQRFKTLEKDQDDLLVCLAQQEFELSILKKSPKDSSHTLSQNRSGKSSLDNFSSLI